MKWFRDKIKNRIKNTKGMSLGEILVATLIMVLMTSALVTTVSLGVGHYKESISNSEANVLSSTLQSVMTNELAYTTEIHVDGDGNVTAFQSQNYATASALSTFFVSGNSGYGKMMIGTASDPLKLLGDGSYPNNMGVKLNTFTYDKDKCMFTIEIIIGTGSTKYLDQTFQFLNVNKTVPVTD